MWPRTDDSQTIYRTAGEGTSVSRLTKDLGQGSTEIHRGGMFCHFRAFGSRRLHADTHAVELQGLVTDDRCVFPHVSL